MLASEASSPSQVVPYGVVNLCAPPLVRIRPQSGWAALDLGEVWAFRDLLFGLAGRDVRLRYRQTALGIIWVVLQPLLGAGIFSFVFGKIAKLQGPDGVPYFLFSYAGMLAWTAFSSTLTKSSTCLVGNSQLISKIYFPRLILPLSTVASALVDFAVGLALIPVLMFVAGIGPSWSLLLLPLWLLLLLTLAAGIGLWASALSVSYRDVQFIIPVAVQFLLYGSPIAYPLSAVPPHLRTAMLLNPLSGLLDAFRHSLLGRGEMNWGAVAYSATFAIVVLVAGAISFKRMERRFADVI
jgi:lipopolysaccharide transport system permease protein